MWRTHWYLKDPVSAAGELGDCIYRSQRPKIGKSVNDHLAPTPYICCTYRTSIDERPPSAAQRQAGTRKRSRREWRHTELRWPCLTLTPMVNEQFCLSTLRSRA